jgi:hypothetical protein
MIRVQIDAFVHPEDRVDVRLSFPGSFNPPVIILNFDTTINAFIDIPAAEALVADLAKVITEVKGSEAPST